MDEIVAINPSRKVKKRVCSQDSNSVVSCPDCDSVHVEPDAVMSFPEWGKKNDSLNVLKKYHCLDCGLHFEAPSHSERQEMKNGITLLIVVGIMIVMLLIVLL